MNGSAVSRLKVATAMGLSFALVILMGLLIALIARVQLEHASSETKQLVDDRMAKVSWTRTIQTNLNRQAIAIRDIALKKHIDELRAETGAMFKKLQETVDTEQARQILTSAFDARNAYNAAMNKAIDAGLAGDAEGARTTLNTEGQQAQAALSRPLEDLVSLQRKLMEDTAKDVQDRASSAGLWMLVIAAIAVVAGAAIAWLLTRSITRQLGGEPHYASAVAREIAAGNLAVEVDVKAGDQASLLANMREMRDNLAKVVGQVRSGTDTVAT
ncbi:MAG: MCP four helix bundle domain-containing protein, partial [Thiobacillus sp.]|nr:MCP four helix bundle domain-containing protein [Thiobacillus sp.]